MRCAKCGYISFDHLDSCPKCHKAMDHGQFQGTTYPVAPPLFFQPGQKDEVGIAEDEIVDILDPDLDLFADDGSEVVDFEDNPAEEQGAMKADMQAAGDEISPGLDFEKAFAAETYKADVEPDEKELTIDTSGFTEELLSVPPAQGLREGSLEIPEELADISDLAPPAAAVVNLGFEAATTDGVDGSIKDALSLDDLSLDDLELDELQLSFEDKKDEPFFSPGKPEEKDILSLDDIDLSGILEAASPQKQDRSKQDDDLDFDFDLGGIGETKGKGEERKKRSDDFPDFNLSLD